MILKRAYLFFFCINLVMQGSAQKAKRGIEVQQDSSATTGNKYAIIIGISDYKNVPHLQYAHRDAQAFEDFLLSRAGGSLPRINIETFLNENATRNNVSDAISVFARKVKPGDRLYFFFAGHGDMEDLTQVENGLLLLYNSPNGNYFGMNDDVLQIYDLKRYLSPLAERGIEMIFIVDACHSGKLSGGVEGLKQTSTALMAAWGKEYKILSCQPNQLSEESAEWGGGRGLFSLELEEGMKGLADLDSSGQISMFELQTYLQTNVIKYSESRQIPMISGDLSKFLFRVDPPTLAALKKEKAGNYPIMAVANQKGNYEKYIDSLDPSGKALYASFKKNIEGKKLILPKDSNALRDYREFIKNYRDNPIVPIMRRNLAAALNDRFNKIVAPLLKDATSYSTREECYFAAEELDSCLQLLGSQHYMYNNLKGRKLFMDAMALTWALSESEYNISLKPVVEKSIKLLEQSEAFEPNAAYTLSALGVRYFFVYEYEKAFAKFQKYLDLRPNDFYSRYSLALIYRKLEQYDKAIELLKKLVEEKPTLIYLYTNLIDTYLKYGKTAEAHTVARKVTASVDSIAGFFNQGIYFAQTDNLDSSVYYFKACKKNPEWNSDCDNNIGQAYYVHNKIDSARHYFNLSLSEDSTNPYPIFNLATIDAVNGKTRAAISGFFKAIYNITSANEAYVTHLELYFGKKYNFTDSSQYNNFRNKAFHFDTEYLSYLSVLYCLIRDSVLINNDAAFEQIFTKLFDHKDHDVLTWYHHACYKALKHDKDAALASLEKSLKLGFGNYFMITSDNDLAFVHDTREFKALLAKYFPEEVKKTGKKK